MPYPDTPLLIEALPTLKDAQARPPAGVWWRPREEFVEELANWLAPHRVLEVFAGNGFLAAHLRKRGVRVQATTRFSSHDAHERGVYCEVEELDAAAAVRRHWASSDVLLMCWPTATLAAAQAALMWGSKPLVFIGEVTDYSKGHLGGCASDEFFELVEPEHRFESYQGNMLEQAFVGRVRVDPEKQTRSS